MVKKKSLRSLRKIMAVTLVLSMIFGLTITADIFYPTEFAEAASFATSGSGVSAPAFNAENFPSLNTSGGTKYYYGKTGNAFYGVTDKQSSGYWELVDTDSTMNGTALSSQWGSRYNGQTILNYTNGLTGTYFLEADKAAMKTKDVSVDTYHWDSSYTGNGTGSLTGAYMWPLSAKQLIKDGSDLSAGNSTNISDLAKKLYSSTGSSVWTRSFLGYFSGGDVYGAWNLYSSDVNNNYVTSTCRVAPAFNLDLAKVLIARSASSSTSETSLSSTSKASGDLKFLINAGNQKGSFNVSEINGKTLTNVFPGKTYDFKYTGASTSILNGGKNYISAILYDSTGAMKYYGNLKAVTESSGTASITIPNNLSGNYTLAVFEEEKCAANKTDYASAPVYANFKAQTTNYETGATITSSKNSSVQAGDNITSSDFSADVTYLDGTTGTGNVYVLSSDAFNKVQDKRTINSSSVTVPSGSSSFKVTAVYIPQYTDGITAGYVAKEFTYNVNYESSTQFSTTHSDSFSLNDTITSSEFEGETTWIAGNKTKVSSDDIYIVPTSVWNSGMSKNEVQALDTYKGGKSIKITDSELNGAQKYSITVVYFPTVAGAELYHTQTFEFASSSLYTKSFKATYNGDSVEYGDLLTDTEFSGKYVLSDGDSTEVEASTKYILPTSTWNSLSDSVKKDEAQLKKVKGVNSLVVPSESDLQTAESYSVTVVYYDYSDQHSHGGGTAAEKCNYYSVDVNVPLVSAIYNEYRSYTASGITWYYKLDDNDAINVHTVNEDINQVIDKNGVLNIPEKVDGHVVKSIGTGTKARPFIPANINSFTSIKFPDTLTDVNDYAFYANSSFIRLVVPASVGRIGSFAFYDCDNISNVKISSTVLGAAAFGNCDGLVEVAIGGTSTIGKVAFAECSSLKKLTVGGTTDIGKSAFANDAAINAINMKELNGSEIANYAFKDCTSIKEVYIPSSNTVKAYAFDGCTGITNLELDITKIENHSFERCSNIRYLVFGRNVNIVEYNWGGYSEDVYENNDDYTEIIDTTVYVKNKDTLFQTYRDGEEYYSAFMGHYISSGSYKYSRNVNVFMPKEASTGHRVDGTLAEATANYYQTAQDDDVENGNTYKKYYTANSLLNISFEADENVDDKTINLPSSRDGITAYYNGKLYDNAKADKTKIIVNPIYSDAASAEKNIEDFNFYDEEEADVSIRSWIKNTDYSYKNVIDGKLENKVYSYSQYLSFVENNTITGDELEKERLAMIQSIFDDKSLFLQATNEVIDVPEIIKVTSNQDYAIQHLNVIYYPNKDSNADPDYNDNEPKYYITSFDVKVVKYTDEQYFFDQGFTYSSVASEIKELQNKIKELTDQVSKLEDDNNDLANTNNQLSDDITSCKEELNQYVSMYNKLVTQLNDYMGSTEVDKDGYFGNKTETDESGKETVIKVVWVNGVECTYETTEETTNVEGQEYKLYIGNGDIDNDSTVESFKFYVATDGVHVVEIDGETADEVYSDPIRSLERKLTAQLTAIRSQLEVVNGKIVALKTALGIVDEDFDDLTSEQQLDVILKAVNKLVSEKEQLETELSNNESTINQYESAIDGIYDQLVSGELDKSDVNTLQKKLTTIFEKIESIQKENTDLITEVASLNLEITSLKAQLAGKDANITDKDDTINEYEDIVENLKSQIADLNSAVSEQQNVIKGLNDNLSSLKKTNEDLEGKNSELKEEIVSLSSNISSLEDSNKEQQKRIENLSGTLSNKQQEIDEGTATIEDLQETIKNANGMVEELKKENESQATTITSLRNNVSSLSSLCEEQKGNIADLNSSISDLQGVKEQLEKTVSSLNSTVSKLQTQNTDLQTTISGLKQTIADKDVNIKELNETIEKLNKDISGYQQKILEQNTRIQELEKNAGGYVITVEDAANLFGSSKNASSEEVKQAINAFVAAKIENEKTIKSIQSKLGTTANGDALVALVGSTSNTGTSTDNSSLKAENEALRKEVDSLSSALQAIKNNIGSAGTSTELATSVTYLSQQLSKVQATNLSLSDENLDLKSKNISLENTNTELTDKTTKLSEENKKYSESNSELSAKVSELSKENTTLTEKNKSYLDVQKTFEKLEQDNKKLSDANDTLKKGNTALSKKVNSLITKNDSLTKKVNSLKKKSEQTGSNVRSSNNVGTTNNSSSNVTPNYTVPRYTISTTPAPTAKPTSSPKDASNSTSKPADTPKPTSSENGMGISGTMIGNTPSVISIKMPAGASADDVDGKNIVGLNSDEKYVNSIDAKENELNETSDDVKKNANAIFAYFATNVDEIEKMGLEDVADLIPDNAAEEGTTLAVNALTSVDVLPTLEQENAINHSKKVSVELSSDKLEDEKTYLIVHESEDREGMFDIAVAKATNGSISIELEDLSPISIAEISVSNSSSFKGTDTISPEKIEDDSNAAASNGKFKLIYLVLIFIAIAGVGACAFLLSKQKKGIVRTRVRS